jgi:hypothetical protein
MPVVGRDRVKETLWIAYKVVDGWVRRIDYGYDNLGRQTYVRSRVGTDPASSLTNEVAYTYSEAAWGQLTKVAQAHTGPADASTPAMQYTYEDGAVSGIAKYVRQATRIYPNGRVVTNQYNSGLDSTLSRLSGVTDPGSTNALIQPIESSSAAARPNCSC